MSSPGPRTAVIACGALAFDVRAVARRRGWDVDVVPVPALLHNRPERIAGAVASELRALGDRYEVVAVAYGDCGTYGALDEALGSVGVARLEGDHCYDVLARYEVAQALADQPGTYFLTDFLARTFEHTVWRGRSCATSTSVTTPGSSGWLSVRRRRHGRAPSQRPPD